MKTGHIVAITYILASTCVLALSNGANASSPKSKHNDPLVDYARVTQVTPIYDTIEQQVPQENCWMEKVENEPRRRHAPRKPIIAGALIGGAIGNAVGVHHDNKHAGILVGSLIGASIGRGIADRQDAQRTRQRTTYTRVERCEVQYITEAKQELVGYDVNYQYGGQIYHTEMARHPGKKIKVAVNVSPVYF